MHLPRFPRIPLLSSTGRAGRPVRTLTVLAAAACVVGLVAASGLANAGPLAAAPTATYLDPKSPTSTSDLLAASRAAQGATGAQPTP